MTADLDQIDLRIVALLSEDGRMQNTDVARRLGVTEGMVRKRIAALLDRGVFQFTIWANPLKIGYAHLLQFDVQAQPGTIQQFADELAKMRESVFVGICLGAFDVRAIAVARSREHMLQLTLQINQMRGVQRSTATSIVSIGKPVFDYAVEANGPEAPAKRARRA